MTKYIIDTSAIKQWADTLHKLIGTKELKKTLKWWKSKKAKSIWGTDRARAHREALKEKLKGLV